MKTSCALSVSSDPCLAACLGDLESTLEAVRDQLDDADIEGIDELLPDTSGGDEVNLAG